MVQYMQICGLLALCSNPSLSALPLLFSLLLLLPRCVSIHSSLSCKRAKRAKFNATCKDIVTFV